MAFALNEYGCLKAGDIVGEFCVSMNWRRLWLRLWDEQDHAIIIDCNEIDDLCAVLEKAKGMMGQVAAEQHLEIGRQAP